VLLYPGPATYPWPGANTAYTTIDPDNPFIRDGAVYAMMPDWALMAAVTNGTSYIQSQAQFFLAPEPREDADAYQKRVSRSLLSPYTLRLIENAAGMVLRRPITITGDDFWKDFASNVDGLGSSINEYARRLLTSALTYGHSAVMVDFPPAEGIVTLADELNAGRRPYFIHIDADQIWGWRQESTLPGSALTQIRLYEIHSIPDGRFSTKQEERIRVIYPGRYELYNKNGLVESGTYSLERLPIVPIYTNRTGMLTSKPPLLDIASINVTHYQRQADLIHALHIAAMPTLILEGWDDDISETSVGVNYAMSMTPGNKAYYVTADSSSFSAQQEELSQLEQQMSTLGVTKLLGQKFVAESADAKRIDQAQANSVLAIISMEVESALQEAFNLAAAYLNRPAPTISLERDFDFYRLLGQDIAVIGDLNDRGALTDRTFLEILKSGEILPDTVDLEAELAEIKKLKADRKKELLNGMLDAGPMGQKGPNTPANAPTNGKAAGAAAKTAN